jgi:hypothetical protein
MIEGPGLQNPLLLAVANAEEAEAFVQALNFAYAQGMLARRRNKTAVRQPRRHIESPETEPRR